MSARLPSPMPPNEASTLAELVQALPAELYNEILGYTFAADEQTVEINKDHKPPVQLQIDRRSREDFARSYYKNTTSMVRLENNSDKETSGLAGCWVGSLPETHKVQLKNIRLARPTPTDNPCGMYLCFWSFASRAHGMCRRTRLRDAGVVRINARLKTVQGGWKEVWWTWPETFPY